MPRPCISHASHSKYTTEGESNYRIQIVMHTVYRASLTLTFIPATTILNFRYAWRHFREVKSLMKVGVHHIYSIHDSRMELIGLSSALLNSPES